MGGLVLVSAMVLCALAGVLVSASPEGSCPRLQADDSEAVLLPHRQNCSVFYICSWGRPVQMICPANLHFNPSLRVCDWPSAAGCRVSTIDWDIAPTSKPAGAILRHTSVAPLPDDRLTFGSSSTEPSVTKIPLPARFSSTTITTRHPRMLSTAVPTTSVLNESTITSKNTINAGESTWVSSTLPSTVSTTSIPNESTRTFRQTTNAGEVSSVTSTTSTRTSAQVGLEELTSHPTSEQALDHTGYSALPMDTDPSDYFTYQ